MNVYRPSSRITTITAITQLNDDKRTATYRSRMCLSLSACMYVCETQLACMLTPLISYLCITMQTDDHSGSMPDIDCTMSPVTATATVVVAPQASGTCNSMEANFTTGML
ncbi:hypothetical protein LOAG_04747 [Loa loa]|uniref:Uncharacterized protein n=1 Tax=Loa loa TaxID=7209 RepID=A0A1S0U1R3_LOALO|nr:hypothetical protein LOAG_04747 [Loa loa]EFO23737.1 hypothetical protein LOAG_04747 [Loa loa]